MPDLLALDEAHYCVGQLRQPWCVPHKIPARYKLSLTATPRIFAGNDGKGPDQNGLKGGVHRQQRRQSNNAAAAGAASEGSTDSDASVSSAGDTASEGGSVDQEGGREEE